MRKIACWCVTRNLYSAIGPSVWSAFERGGIDQAFIIAEDDRIGGVLPHRVTVLDFHNQGFFHPGGPNYHKKWTYMAMMKTAMAQIFHGKERILTLDHDTLILGDLSELWEIPMHTYYVAGCNEPYWEKITGQKYINAGVLMWNLDRIRKDKCDKKMIEMLNHVDLRLPEQECINTVCRDGIMIIDSSYNFCDYVEPPRKPVKVLHFAGQAGRDSWMRKEIWGYR